MGQEINEVRFSQQDFDNFHHRLAQETELLGHWFEEKRFKACPPMAGLELEAWLVNQNMMPAPINGAFLKSLDNPLVTPELATFNVEFNLAPEKIGGNVLSHMNTALEKNWYRARNVANELGADLAMIGILPTVENKHLIMDNLSSMNRYVALNHEILRLRGGRPLQLDIHGKDILRAEHMDVMLESATTSFQIHLQVTPERAVRAYNASIIATAPLVAVSANSPYLFGKDLWAETRIPLFEQSVEVGGYEEESHGPMRRVTFGSGYARQSLMECFTENFEHYPVLLPTTFDTPADEMAHLRLHNGTLWRWNRPLLGFENGEPFLRIEQRVVPAGPTIIDSFANAAFYYGLTYALCSMEDAPESIMDFAQARDNFYTCAQHGLDAHIVWLDGQKYPAKSLLQNVLLPLAKRGLTEMGIYDKDISKYLSIISGRVRSSCNGASWQRAYVAKYGNDMKTLLAAYLERQHTGVPVHDWDL
ncbi:MAG: glutamate--cysteine ligase [Gammaproteobacteria bacterium]|nr:glutamate--cysteine ligase [Gammaproteobacteria bacterium]